MAKRMRVDVSEINVSLDEFDRRANVAIEVLMKYQADKSESYMRTNAPWTDQTGNARNGLFAVSFHDGNQHELVLSHFVPYGIYLETMNSGEFAIVVPAWFRASDELWNNLSKLFDQMTREA